MERFALQMHEEAEDRLVGFQRMAEEHEAGVAPGMATRPRPDTRRHDLTARDGADGLATIDHEIGAAVELSCAAQGERAVQPALAGLIERLQRLGSDRLRLVDFKWKAAGAGAVDLVHHFLVVVDLLIGDVEVAADLVHLHVAEKPLPLAFGMGLEQPSGAHPVLGKGGGLLLHQPQI